MNSRLNRNDLLFLVETFMPESRDTERSSSAIQHDEGLIEAMLADERLFRRLMSDEETLVRVSPWLFFTVLLRQARRDLPGETFTTERRSQQRVVLFDVDQVARLLAQEPLLEYLAVLLASFTRIQSVTVPVRVRKGIWRRYRANDLDVSSLLRYAETLQKDARFEPYRRIADVCLFLSGVFPDYIEAQYRYPLSRQIRPAAKGQYLRSREDYERHGQAFYRLAAEHEQARVEGLVDVLSALSEDFVLAEKPLAFLAEHYLRFTRYRLFDV
jgi:hypothetical protein